MALKQSHRAVAIGTPLGDDALVLRCLSGTEQLGRPFRYEVDLASEQDALSFEDLIGQNVTVRLETTHAETRYFNGFVSRLVQLPGLHGYARYQATVVPWLWFLSRSSDCRIFQDQTVPEIIMQVFRDHGFTDFEDTLTGTYRDWEYCVQYRESHLNFVSRLMEQEGIYYYFRHENGSHTLILTDSTSIHRPYPGYEAIPYYAPEKVAVPEEHIHDWRVVKEVQPGIYAHSDFDFENPRKALHSSSHLMRDHAVPNFEVYDYPGEYLEFGDGEHYARLRIEELHAQYEVVRGESDVRGICPGCTFELTDYPREDQCREYLVTSASYHFESDLFDLSRQANRAPTYSCSFTGIDAREVFRPERITPDPAVQGVQTAIVVGPSGEEIHTDQYGRVKVQFHWDRYGEANENSSCWVRVAQNWAGKKWGTMFIPRIGQEVLVDFLEGDPDRPIITGSVYNGQSMPPFDLPAEKTKTTIKSSSTKGGGGANEISFDDKKGKEQLFIHAQKDQDIRVEKDETEWVGRIRRLFVQKNQLENVRGDKHGTVKGDRLGSISGDEHLTVKGDVLKLVKGDEHLTVKGDQLEEVRGDVNLTVGRSQSEKVRGTISRQAGGHIQESANMKYALEAGLEIHLKAGMNVVIEAGASITLKAGGGFVTVGPAGVAISGTPVLINSGGSAGSGAGSNPKSPNAPEEPDRAKRPRTLRKPKAGAASAAAISSPKEGAATELTSAKVEDYSPAALALKQAAKDGTPFLEKCPRK